MAEVILFTGPAGTRAVRSLRKFRDYAQRAPQDVRTEFLELDDTDFLVDAYLAEYPTDPDAERIRRWGLPPLLLKPQEKIYDLWNVSAARALEGLDTSADLILLCTHAVYYSNRSREFFSPVDIRALADALRKKDLEVSRVVTLIDDVYDVFRQLASQEGIFPVSSTDPAEASITAVIELQLAMYWRAVEIFHARELARQLDKPHLLHAVKHPLWSSLRALRGEESLYLSHPISIVRENERFQDQVQRVTDRLASSSTLPVPIVPTSIDELRLRRGEASLLPQLIPRWHPREGEGGEDLIPDLLFTPSDNPDLNPLDPLGETPEDGGGLMGGLLEQFVQIITQQIAARDRTLVGQSALVVVWRPLYWGELAKGVADEIEHRNTLRALKLRESFEIPVYAYSPVEDLVAYRALRLIDKLGDALGRGSAGLISEDQGQALFARLTTGDLGLQVRDGTLGPVILGDLLKELIPEGDIGLERRGGALAGQRGPSEGQAKDEFLRTAIDDVFRYDPISDRLDLAGGDLLVTEEKSADEFVRMAEQAWKDRTVAVDGEAGVESH